MNPSVPPSITVPFLIGAGLAPLGELWVLYEVLWKGRHNERKPGRESDLALVRARATRLRWWAFPVVVVGSGVAVALIYNGLHWAVVVFG